MIQSDLDRCELLVRYLLGRDCSKDELTQIPDSANNYKEFRIRLFTSLGWVSGAKQVADKWVSFVSRSDDEKDLNEVLHALEAISQEQSKLEANLQEGNRILMDKLSDLDKFATMQIEARERLAEMRALLTKYRHAIANQVNSNQGKEIKNA